MLNTERKGAKLDFITETQAHFILHSLGVSYGTGS